MSKRDHKSLSSYRNKRNLSVSPEPTGEESAAHSRRVFVIQQHDASSMHWDFRLQIGDVLVSWALPKGPSTDPRDKRLAVRTEDHPLDYADFEGTIPEGEYGAGAVIVWDRGEYENLRSGEDKGSCSMKEALRRGQLEFRLHGHKLSGGYALVHARTGGDEKNWLLVKMDDADADARRRPTSTQPESVLSGRTVKEVADTADGDN